ncbi:FAD:protein FMN transferase [Telmatospirillum sp.]|uniref:FAD:protein FMN transferase n=1 Tax=Telmatospirillum sp. TaxID=2079197 RepID=UPI002841C872|nr:FAD:protein FMN transferase [Telmatospirillum sp.]MDR3439377.1 FAD:protein FMN transferase [Telmatospirillum sp.]
MLGRRRFITLSAAAAGLALLPGHRAFAAEPLIWRGNTLGADASLILYAEDPAQAHRLLAQSLEELERLERIFNLYRDDSTLTRLNRDGGLDAPPVELVELLTISRHVSQLSNGAFDVTVQPLWTLYADHFAQANADPSGPSAAAIAALVPRIGWQAVETDSRRIGFARPDMAITLNGIAQGYVTDKIADLLRRQGMRHVLVDMGEIAAVGSHPDGSAWRVGLEGAGEIGLIDRAISTSSADGTRFSATCNHLFDPRSGRCATMTGAVSVIAANATIADALSTAIAVGGRQLGDRMAVALGSIQVIHGTSNG